LKNSQVKLTLKNYITKNELRFINSTVERWI